MVRQAKEYADTWTLTNNRLRLVTSSQADLANTQRQVLELAHDTRSEYAATVELYSRISRSSREFGVSQSEVLGIARTVNQAIRIGGATAQEARAGVIQFGQALASGQLRGEELRSVMEQLIRLSQALAAGLGVGIGDLRRLAESGQLTTNKIIEALQSQAPLIQKEFEQLTPTIGETFTTLNNRVLAFVGNLNELTGVSSVVNASLRGISDAIKSITPESAEAITSVDALVKKLEEVRARIVEVNIDLVGRRVTQSRAPFDRQLEYLRQLEEHFEQIRQVSQNAVSLASALSEIDKQIETIQSQLTDAPVRRLGGRGLADRRNTQINRDRRRELEFLKEKRALLQSLQNQAADQDSTDSRSPERVKELERLLESYQKLGARLGKTKEEYDLLRAAQLGANETQLASIRGVQQEAAALKEAENQKKKNLALLREQFAAELDLLVLMEESRDRADDLAGQVARSDATLSGALDQIVVSPESNSGLQQSLDGYRDLAATIGFTRDQLIDYQLTLQGANQTQIENAQFADNSVQAYKAYLDGIENSIALHEQAEQEARNFGQALAATYDSAILNAIRNGGKFDDVLKALAQDILELIIRITILKPLADSLAATFSNAQQGGGKFRGFLNFISQGISAIGGFGGGGGSSLPSPSPGFSGQFPGLQSGGPAYAGQSYLVGERGPELFRPHVSGSVLSNSDLSRFQGGGGVTVNFQETINIESTDGPGVDRAIARLRPVLEERTEQIVRQVTRADLSRPSAISRN